MIISHDKCFFKLHTVAPMIDPMQSSNITVEYGSSFTISCISRGSPPETFIWYKDNVSLMQTTSTSVVTLIHNNSTAVFRAEYFLDSVTTVDSGTYFCTASNPIGNDTKSINIIVGEFLKSNTM